MGSRQGKAAIGIPITIASNGITSGNMQTLGSDIAPEKARGKFYGVWQTIGTIGAPGGYLYVRGAFWWCGLLVGLWVPRCDGGWHGTDSWHTGAGAVAGRAGNDRALVKEY